MTLEEDVAELSHMQNRKSAASHIFMSIWLEFMTYRPSTTRSMRREWEPNIFPSGSLTQSISILSYDHKVLKTSQIVFQPK